MVYTRFGISIKLANFQNEFNYMLMSAAIMQQYVIEMMYVWFVTVPGRFAPNPVRPYSQMFLSKRNTCLFFFYLEKAYDTTWKYGILE
jgi:hypothetical protein